MADVWFENFKRDIVNAVEEHLHPMESDAANDLAWRIAEEFAWRIWAEMQSSVTQASEQDA